MTLRTALNDFKRTRDRGRQFPGERRSTTGRFSGLDDRLVHVDGDGSLCDYSYPLCGLTGIDRSRFGVETDATTWFDADGDQRYRRDSGAVETVHDRGDWAVVQTDCTIERGHVTRFELRGDAPDDVSLRAFVGFAPDGREGQQSLLVHDGAVEAYHRTEHDFVAVSTDLAAVEGQIPERLPELLDDDPVPFPRATGERRYEDTTLTGGVSLTAPFRDGGVTLATLLTDATRTDRDAALSTVDRLAGDHYTPDTLAEAGRTQRRWRVPHDTPARDCVVADLRVLSLLSAANGARIAAADFDPFYVTSGGYGYTWFRDDAEISGFLLDASETVDLGLCRWLQRSADFYCRTQRADGSWPHRVWPGDETLAPGWANARLESGSNADYQADQTASVAAFLAEFRRSGDPIDPDRIETTLGCAVESIDDTLAEDGLPLECQNAWENMQGRFAHTAATFLSAYAAVARAPVCTALRDHARVQAESVLSGLDALWTGDRYALREHEGRVDDRLDSATLALVDAFRVADEAVGLSPDALDRLVTHVETTLDGLERDTGAVRGLIRFEGDDWRRGTQDAAKVWTVSTAWGANAAAQLGALLRDRDDARAAPAYARSRDLLAEILPGGSLVQATGYLPEQLFDDGTPDCGTPLGWPHALRLATVAELSAADEYRAEPVRAAE
ncbi:glycoside hydrolase family 15 protein [Haloarcula salina]|uniref:Glucan 1,4-alpha-glucosidase n=1 Tax=Haloarcula salina TaxID=1429914 RepID=A0AA41KL69_9EURY|nr:glycoside hydrolase family 15 protein [Haloarcula salina]MBV0902589.1 glucan 1,4-alpha-glucosidase [Haloarcula salina]